MHYHNLARNLINNHKSIKACQASYVPIFRSDLAKQNFLFFFRNSIPLHMELSAWQMEPDPISHLIKGKKMIAHTTWHS